VGQATLPTPPRSNAGVWIALAVAAGLALIGGGGAAFYLIGRNVPQPQPTPPVVHVDPPPLVVAPPSPAHPDPPPKEEVLVDTVPTGAHILENGRTIADAPEVLQISRGATMEVTLHRDGYGDRTVTLDPSREHKVIVRLEKIEHHPSKPPHEQAAKQPAKQLPVVVPISSHPPTPTKKPNGPINPYE
jgi:hypothetical protein